MPVDSGLGRRLQLIQGLHWLYGANGDPYATLLRGFDDDLRPVHEELRRRGVLWPAKTGTWVTASHAVGGELLGHPGLGTRAARNGPAVQRIMTWDQDLTTGDAGPLPGADLVRQACAEAFGRLGGAFDLAEVAHRVPVEVLARVHGLTAAQREKLVPLCADVTIALDSLLCPQRLEPVGRLLDALDGLRALLGEGSPALPHAVLGVRLSADLFTGAVSALLETPGEWAKLQATPRRAEAIVRETLRYRPPVHIHTAFALADLDVAGQAIPAGGQVAVVLSAANRDPAVFPEPDRFDPDRAGTPALATGSWLPLARLHAETALIALAARFPRMRADGSPSRRGRAPVTRGLLRLPVRAD
ncbi:P450-derived glycosyltransferase activator [Amycolatopsis sp. NPDC059019]|uniref:cytochrome P450 family protein n=1 Tax=unclassified Amycolatopsis TaxID=2618356 RepID=UPI00366FE293